MNRFDSLRRRIYLTFLDWVGNREKVPTNAFYNLDCLKEDESLSPEQILKIYLDELAIIEYMLNTKLEKSTLHFLVAKLQSSERSMVNNKYLVCLEEFGAVQHLNLALQSYCVGNNDDFGKYAACAFGKSTMGTQVGSIALFYLSCSYSLKGGLVNATDYMTQTNKARWLENGWEKREETLSFYWFAMIKIGYAQIKYRNDRKQEARELYCRLLKLMTNKERLMLHESLQFLGAAFKN